MRRFPATSAQAIMASVDGWTERYLRLLGLSAPSRPDLDWLARFGAAHLRVVPFCNVTSILRRHSAAGETVPPLDHEAQLAVWEQRSGGGVCFEITEMVSKLLGELGYETHIVLGQITFPASHQAVVVRLREGPYLIDLGCGEPLPDPIPLIRTTEYHVAGLGYRFRPDLASMTCAQDRLIDGKWKELCLYDLHPADEAVRSDGYQRHHTPGETWVTRSLTLMRYFQDDGAVVSLRENRLSHYRDSSKQSREVTDDAELTRLLADDLSWPELPVTEAIRALRELNAR